MITMMMVMVVMVVVMVVVVVVVVIVIKGEVMQIPADPRVVQLPRLCIKPEEVQDSGRCSGQGHLFLKYLGSLAPPRHAVQRRGKKKRKGVV